jgi:drug/metabolite transporter (DMT)-like permease
VSWQSIVAFAYLVIVGSIMGYSAYIWLLQNVSAAAVSTYAYVNPIVAVALGWLFLREPIGMTTLNAGAMIVAAVVLITLRRRKPVDHAGMNASKPPALAEVKRGLDHVARKSSSEKLCERV